MRIIKMFISLLAMLFFVGCGNSVNADELIGNASLAVEHDDYNVAVDYYKQVLTAYPDNAQAKYGLEDIFETALSIEDYTLAQNIYSYFYCSGADSATMGRLQEKIIKHDEYLLGSGLNIFYTVFLSPENTGEQSLKNIDRELFDFIENYDIGFKKSFEEIYTRDYFRKNIIWYDENGNIISNLETHILIIDTSGSEMKVGLYIKDTKEKEGDFPVHTGSYVDLSEKTLENEEYPFDIRPHSIGNKMILFEEGKEISSKISESNDINGDTYVVMSKGTIPVDLIGCVIYNQTTDEYFLIKAVSNRYVMEVEKFIYGYEAEKIDVLDVEKYINY